MVQVTSTSFAQLSYAKEIVYGVTPTTGTGTNLRMTGDSLEQQVSKETSKEIESSRQVSSMFLTDGQVSGGFNIELSAGEYDPFIEAVLMDPWKDVAVGGKTAPESVVFTANTATFTTFTPTAATLVAGQYVSFSGTGIDRKNRGPFRVVSFAGKVLTFEAGSTVAQTVAGCTMSTSRITNGVTPSSFSVQRTLSDVGQHFVYRGLRADKFTLSVASKAAITGSFDFIGASSSQGNTKYLAGATYTPSKTAPIIDGVLGFSNVYFDGVKVSDAITAGVKTISLEYSNAMQGLDALGTLGNVEVMVGTIDCSGTIEMYFNNSDLFNHVLTQKRFNISWSMFDNMGNGYSVTLPSVELNAPTAPVGGKDEPLLITVSYTALKDPVTGKTIFIDRF